MLANYCLFVFQLIEVPYIVVEMMKHLHGEQWNQEFVAKVMEGRGIEKVLL